MKLTPRRTAPYLICGLHRSGTTYVGSILSHEPSLAVLHEPMNERFGVEGVPVAYPFVTEDGLGECAPYAELLDEIVSLKRPWNKDAKHIKAKGLRRLIYKLIGGRSGFRWSWLCLRNRLWTPPRRLCLKDPFATLATAYLLKHHDARVVCMARHPAAIHYSTEKQNWWFDINNLLRQTSLMKHHAADIPDEHWQLARKSHAAGIALLWKMMVRINDPLASEDERLLLVRHEDLCLKPTGTAKRICEHFDIGFTQKIEQYVRRNSKGGAPPSVTGRRRDFERDSKAIVDEWRGHVRPGDERLMQEIIGDEFRLWYPKW